MKMTFNRRLILAVLGDEIEGRQPPHSVSSIWYSLDNAFKYKRGHEPYLSMATLPTKRQLYRTLKELWEGGLIVGARIKSDDSNTRLAYWENEYQLSGDVYKNSLITDCTMTYNKVNRAKYGVNFFGAAFDRGLPAHEVATLKLRVKSLMQRTHPDKATGYEAQFIQMKQCLDWIKSGVPLPAPTHAAGNQSINHH
jgi:hypothetical protein